jgi:hypothetical protein
VFIFHAEAGREEYVLLLPSKFSVNVALWEKAVVAIIIPIAKLISFFIAKYI